MKILLIDDDRTSLAVTRLAVEKCGYEVMTLQDSRLAIETIRDNGIRAVVSDWVMPGLSGLDLVRTLRADPLAPYVYFIVLTGTRLGELNFMEAMDAGADDFMEKPANGALLRIRLRVAMRMLKLDGEVSALRRLIPICSFCKRVRRDDQVYEQIEAYVTRHSSVKFSHGICPECAKKHYPGRT